MTYRTTTMRRSLTLACVIASVISLAGPAYAGYAPPTSCGRMVRARR